MTDLRASLGIEQTTGPILGALGAEDYTDVIILGFTNPVKTKRNSVELQQKISSLKGANSTEKGQFIDLFSNTAGAHAHFEHWLGEQLRDGGKQAKVHFHSVDLKQLNDTEGIYEAATKSLNIVAGLESEKIVTLYLSPGTPVMAFVWAFAALRHPTLKKRLIASSRPGRPPESIVLPNEWLEWHGRQVRTADVDSDQFDVIFHLFGEQRMPSLLGMMQFSSKKHIFVNSAQFPADVMKQFIGEASYGEVAVDPYDPENTRSVVLELIAEMPSDAKIGFNLTGGTKLMYAGALAACRKVNATPFYFNNRNNQVIYLNDFKSFDTKLIPSVETFIKLNGNSLHISKAGYWDEIPNINNPSRTALTKHLWSQRSTIAGLYRRLAPLNDKPRIDFSADHKHISVSLKDGHKAEIIIKNRNGKESVYRFQNWPDFSRYLTGGWFEEYTFLKLQPLLEAGLIKDMRIGLEVSFKEDVVDKEESSIGAQQSGIFGETYQELDITFTDGRRLYVIECKAGSIKGVYVRKLESITRYFGGISGKGIMVGCFAPRSSVVKQKALEASNVQLITGGNLFQELEVLIYKEGG